MIPYGKQDISEEDIQAVVDVLKSNFLTQGPTVPLFEKAVADYCNVKHAIAVNSATSALHIACLSLNVGQGDIVWTSPISFVASANCAIYCGATVDFVDIDNETYNMSIKSLEEKLLVAEKNGQLPKVVIPVHLAGQSCDMVSIKKLSDKYGFKIIEDGSHAIGAKYLNEQVGNCKYSDICIFSFHPVKIITTGEGGMCVTNNDEIANSLFRLRSHGIVKNTNELLNKPDGPWYYEQIDLGFNYRMTDIQAALGLSQLKRLDEFVIKRHKIALNYNKFLIEDHIKLPYQDKDAFSSFHLYIIRINNTKNNIGHLNFFENLRNDGIIVNLHYIPIYKQPFYKKIGYDESNFPNAEKYYKEAISIPIYYSLSNEQQEKVIEKLLHMKAI
jgi:UDP-4-amino-4,6-dideoxy-N-acetyl-beta-L-altrosamine transaminase